MSLDPFSLLGSRNAIFADFTVPSPRNVSFGALTCGLLVTTFTGADLSGRSLPEIQSLPSASLLKRSLESESGFELAEGHWQFPGIQWTIQQSAPKILEERLDPETPDSVVVHPGELDAHLLRLIKSLLTIETTDGKTRIYRLHSAELAGTAVTVLTRDNEIPVSLRFCWPAYGGLWTEVVAQRLPGSDDAARSLLQLPQECEIVATRVAADGSVLCHLISSPRQGSNLRNQFAADGWNLDEPPAETGVAGLFWISSSTGRFEVSVNDVAGGSGCTAIVRPI